MNQQILIKKIHGYSHDNKKRKTYLAKDWKALVLIFLFMSFVGLALETLQHLIVFGSWESRAGLIWGPFSPIYGLASVILTILLEPIAQRGIIVIFLVSALVGGLLEYAASWFMETYWGVVAWSYLDAPFNFNGRTDLFHVILWGILGVVWVKIGLPIAQNIYNHFPHNKKSFKIIMAIITAFVVFDFVVTLTVLLRCDARANNIAASNAIEQLYDNVYTDEVLQNRFNNMGGIGIP